MTNRSIVHVIDDDEPVRSAFVYAMEAIDRPVLTYTDGEDFLRNGRSKAGLLLSDVRMPGMNGVELARFLRISGCTMPIILMTGHSDHALRAEALRAGADLVLLKPVAFEVVIEAIDRLDHD